MRRKIYTKEQILKAAYDVVSTEGFAGFTARNIAKRMGISTQPIYLEFKNMEDLKNELLDMIFLELKDEIFPVQRTGDKVIDLGLNYIDFAKKDHNLYLALFVDEEGGGKKMHDFSFNYFSSLIENDPQYANLTQEQIEMLHTGTWVVVTGLASLSSSGSINPTQEQIVSLIKRTVNNIVEMREAAK
ncbi:TetR family transcriptional regulator [Enterococcus sp. JM4C]|uniref:TetR/AcrR family transcriptional regulator n=1 Tax=Candidatus Enterococcus huntleyi TaxID=1857217 RepID=UPI00137ABA49|nr:TetR/AcrR family transcriptional regulator [Enterococcus sp. JM4C]KAF1297456.1 TetR family transcriptional regulator [Enterococcus sp. JM4C]